MTGVKPLILHNNDADLVTNPKVSSAGVDDGPSDQNAELIDLSQGRGEAFRKLYELWVNQGGEVKGKTHHSLRRIKQWLGDQNEVKSLETKLSGRTKLQRQDAKNLLNLFFNKWTYDQRTSKHSPYDGDIKHLIEETLAKLYPPGQGSIQLPDRSRSDSEEKKFEEDSRIDNDPTQLARSATQEHFRRSNAYITVSRENSVLGSDPASALFLFRSLLSDLYEIDRQDEKDRALIWAVDLGTRENTVSGRQTLLNQLALSNLFDAIALMSTSQRAVDLWNWLLKHAVILVSSLQEEWIDRCYEKAGIQVQKPKIDVPWFVADRVTLHGVPNDWLEQSESIAKAFNLPFHAVWARPTITIDIAINDINLDEATEDTNSRGHEINFHYHGIRAEDSVRVGATPPDNEEPQPRARNIDLKRLSFRWQEIFGLVTTAAFGRLGWEKSAGGIDDPDEALALCRKQGMAVLRPDEFLDLSREIRLGIFSTED